MYKKLKERLKGKQGFTLLEMLMVVTVIVVIGGVVAVGILGYMKSSYMIKARQTAETAFYAAQNYLIDQKEQGGLAKFNTRAKKCGDVISQAMIKNMLKKNGYTDPEITEFEKNHTSSSFRYMYLDDIDSASERTKKSREVTDVSDNNYNALYQEILEPYLKDENISDHSFLVEYDAASGVVMSVFYSEKIDGFINEGSGQTPYAADVPTDIGERWNVIKRDNESLNGKWQGYYGVDATNELTAGVEFYAPKVKLVNGERLYLEWQEPVVNRSEGIDLAELQGEKLSDNLYFEVTVKARNRTGLSFKISNKINKAGAQKSWDDIETKLQADPDTKDPLYVYTVEDGKKTYRLLLDCLHGSIRERYGQILSTDMIACTVKTGMENYKVTGGEKDSNYQSSSFGGGAATTVYESAGTTGIPVDVGGSGNLDEKGKREDSGKDNSFSISCARHLNNMRNVTKDMDFSQTGNISWEKVEGKDHAAYFEPLVFVKEIKSSAAYEAADFTGSYVVKKPADSDNYKISGLKIKSISAYNGSGVGMFVINGGIISGLRMEGAVIEGVSEVGAVAGTNNAAGSLSDIQVDAAVSGYRLTAEGTGGQNIGGVAGINKGKAENIKALANTKSKAQNAVTGAQNVGGIFGLNESAQVKELTNYNNVQVLKGVTSGWQNYGGIAGKNSETGVLTNCTNTGILQLNSVAGVTADNQPKHLGGVAGLNYGTLAQCKSMLSAKDGRYETILKGCINALNKVNGTIPEYVGSVVGGVAGASIGDKAVMKNCASGSVVLGYELAGGLAGVSMQGAKVEQGNKIYSDNDNTLLADGADTDGLIIATKDMAGGIFAYLDSDLTAYTNRAHVFAGSLAGGITGINGAAFDTLDTLEAYDFSGAFQGKKDGTKAYYAELLKGTLDEDTGTLDKAKKITKCDNNGFIYASTRYSGGLAGINAGTIENSQSIQKQDTLIKDSYANLSKADCVGGIAGMNKGTITGSTLNADSNTVYGKSFAGGIVGFNVSTIKNYRTISASVIGSGNYVGGYIGMNTDSNIMYTGSGNVITCQGNQKITGKNYVGGLVGANVVAKGDSSQFIIRAETRAGTTIKGEAYTGGIVGYHSVVSSVAEVPSICQALTAADPYAQFDSTKRVDISQLPQFETRFEECSNLASVSGFRYVGGIVGYNEENSRLLVTKGQNYGYIRLDAEGLAASKYNIPEDLTGNIPDDVTGTSYFVGSITGRNSPSGTIESCFSNGKVESQSRFLGGLCEINEGIIKNCTVGSDSEYKDSAVVGSKSVGGIVGLNHTVSEIVATVDDCDANMYASISGGDNTGGLVGTNRAIVKNCMSISTVSSGGNNVGGIAGLNAGSMQDNNVGGNINWGPSIRGKNYVGGFIGKNTGTIDGSGNVIQELDNYATVKGENYVGGIVGSHNAEKIFNCTNYGVIEATGGGATGNAGGISGVNAVAIVQCRNQGTVKSENSRAGGITGYNMTSGTIQECTNTGVVRGAFQGNGEDAVGGIAAINTGTITNCDAIKSADTIGGIEGGAAAGGIVGWNRSPGRVENTKAEKQSVTIGISNTRTIGGTTIYIGGIIGRNDSTAQKEVKNFKYSGDMNITNSQYQCIGGIIGYVQKGYTVQDCEFTGVIRGNGNNNTNGGVGGITGVNEGTIVLNAVNGEDKRYGISTQKPAADAVSVRGSTNIGGIVGRNTAGSGVKCTTEIPTDQDHLITNYIQVTGVTAVGGLYGRSEIAGTQSHLRNQGTIIGKTRIGGVIGDLTGGTGATLLDAVNEASGVVKPNASNGENIGGVVGGSTGNIQNCINEGTVGAEGDFGKYTGVLRVGGIVGSATGSANATTINFVTITGSKNLGQVLCGTQMVGGIAGDASNYKVSGCVNGLDAASNKTVGRIEAHSSSTGGIVGESGQNAEIRDCENYGSIRLRKVASSASSKKNLYAGGIIGRAFDGDAKKKVILYNCMNYGSIGIQDNVNMQENIAETAIAGVIGYIWQGIEAEKVENHGDINVNYVNWVGGIIGKSMIAQSAAQDEKGFYLKAAVNKGNITGGDNVGGLIGRQEQWNGFQITGSSNKGVISGGSSVGGLIGNLYNNNNGNASSKIENCQNEGAVITRKLSATASGATANIGGCIGGSTTANVPLKSLTNTGSITAAAGISSMTNVGGILGAGNGNILEDCVNKVKIQPIPLNTSMKITYIGGIAGDIRGSGSYDGKLLRCRNENSLIAGTDSTNVGGIVGSLNGEALECKNAGKEQKEVTTNLLLAGNESPGFEVTGGTNVGGIAGTVNGTLSKIMGTVTKTEDAKKLNECGNQMDITGVDTVGGIVGEQKQSMVHTVYNTGAVKMSINGNAAGGIVGVSRGRNDSLNTGIIVNSHNVGTVGFTEEPESEIKGFIGGIVGFRDTGESPYGTESQRKNISDRHKCNSSIIKDSYYLKERVAKTRPAEAMNYQKEVPITTDSLAVGNEPFVAFSTPNGDLQHSDLANGKFEWSETAYVEMLDYMKLKPNDYPWNPDDPFANIETVLKNYVYKLPVPEAQPVTGVEEYTYNMKWKGQVGLNRGFDIMLYDKKYTLEELNGNTPPAALQTMHVSEQSVEGVDLTISKNVAEQYMGQELFVGVQAKGYTEAGIIYTTDSDRAIIQSFVVMPPLRKAVIESEKITQVKGQEVNLYIENIRDYLIKPNVDYPVLGTLKEDEIYSAYQKGLAEIVITDYYKNSATEGLNIWKSVTRIIPFEAINWEEGTASLTIDYSTAGNKIDDRIFHTYEIQAKITPEAEKLPLQKDAPGFEYRYLSSGKTYAHFKLRVEKFLEMPERLDSEYTGDTVAPAFNLTWQNPAYNKDRTVSFEIAITNPQNGRVIKRTVPGTQLAYTATQEDLLELMDNFETENPGSSLTYTVKAIGNQTDYKDSYESEPAGFTVPLKDKAPEKVFAVVEDPIFKPHIASFTWQDSAAGAENKYYLKAIVTDELGEEITDDVIYPDSATDPACKVQISPRFDDAYKVELQVIKEGTYGKTLNSNAGSGTYTICRRLPRVNTLLAQFLGIDTDPNKINYTVSWTVPEGITAENCSGFMVSILSENEVNMEHAQNTFINNPTAVDAIINFDISKLGGSFRMYMYALGIDGISSISKPVEGLIYLPADRLSAPVDLHVSVKDELGTDLPDPCDKEVLQKANYTLTWTNEQEELISGHRIMLKDKSGKSIPLGKDENGIEVEYIDLTGLYTSYEVAVDLTAYAEQEVMWSVINVPYTNKVLSSLPAEKALKLPKLTVKTPENPDKPEIPDVSDTSGNLKTTQLTKVTNLLK